MSISMKAIAFMPISMPQKRKVALKIFLDDNNKPSERERDVILEMQKGGFKEIGRKDYVMLSNSSKININYKLNGPKEYQDEKRNVSVTRFPRWPKIIQYYVQREDEYKMEGEIEIFQEDKFVTSFAVKAALTHDRFNYSLHTRDLDEPDSVQGFSSSESESDSEDSIAEELDSQIGLTEDQETVHTEEKNDKPRIRPYAVCDGTVGKQGGQLDVHGSGVLITIPNGALQNDVNITVELIPSSMSKAVSRKNETSACHAIRCTPQGLKLDKPMTISCEHCAKISPSVKTGDTPVIVYSSTDSTGLDEGRLTNLAMAIETDQHMDALGRELGYTTADINKYADTNTKGGRTTSKGTCDMLLDWKKKMAASQQQQKLTEALHRAGLVMLADTHLKNVNPNKAIAETQLIYLAKDLETDEQMEDLGQALGCSVAEINRYTETNKRGGRITYKGTQDMLFDWRQKVSPGEQHQRLTEALKKARLVELCEKYLKDAHTSLENPTIYRQEMRAPDCRIGDKTIEFEVDEFRTYEVRLPTEILDGKVVGYLPFLPLGMPKTRKPVLNVVIYDNVQGRKEGICEDMETMGRISRDIERLFIIASSVQDDLQVSCTMEETGEALSEPLDLLDLNLGKNVVDFPLDFNNLSTNESNVKVTLTHGKRRRHSILLANLKENEIKTAWGTE